MKLLLCSVPASSLKKISLYVVHPLRYLFPLQEDNSIKWASRWDYILVSMPHTNIQWFRYGVILFLHNMNSCWSCHTGVDVAD